MDSFFAVVPIKRKTRVHFHAFMRDVHAELTTLKREVDPLATVAARIARRWRLVCFDEFHVSDIADAMILGRLLTALFAGGVVFVLTSNYPPEGLYPNGLQRQNFVPTIRLLRDMARRARGGRRHRLPAAHAGAHADVPRARGRAGRRRDGARVRGDAHRPGRARAAGDRGPHARGAAPRGLRRLVRLRGAVRRPALAARLPRARAALRRRVPVRHPGDERRAGRPRAALHVADRHPVRPPREARRVRRRAGRAISTSPARTRRSTRAPSAA